MKRYLFVIFVFGIALTQVQGSAIAQATQNTEAALQAARFRAGEAYRQLQQAQYEAMLAEQNYLNAQDAQRAAQDSDASKREFESTKRAFDAAQASVSAARKAYDKEVNAVDRLHKQASVEK